MPTDPRVLAIVDATAVGDLVLSGHRLVDWSVAAGEQAECVDRVIVVTNPDSRDEILTDLAAASGYRPDVLVWLDAKWPLRSRGCVDGAVRLLRGEPRAAGVRSVGRTAPACDTGHVRVAWAPGVHNPAAAPHAGELLWEVDGTYAVLVDSAAGLRLAELVLAHEAHDCVHPSFPPRPLPNDVELVVFDFDGVLTDNRVWVDSEGRELVAAHRGDGWGLARLREAGVGVVVLSTEANPVVTARCEKLGVECQQGLADKGSALAGLLTRRGIDSSRVVYVGNDANDLDCFARVACAVVVADAHPSVLRHADLVLTRPGGHGAVRELCDLILERRSLSSSVEDAL